MPCFCELKEVKMKPSLKELKPKDLRYYPELAKYKGKTTKDIKPVSLFSFQKRGFEALDFGMDVRTKGFNRHSKDHHREIILFFFQFNLFLLL